MKLLTGHRVNNAVVRAALFTLLISIAFCKPLLANPLDEIDNATLRSYTAGRLESGAWSLQVPARALYRDAMETRDTGDPAAARRKLEQAASLFRGSPDPMFALARIDIREANPDFIIHLIEGYKRSIRGFYGQALLAVNLVIILTAVAAAVLFLTLIFLIARHWPEYDHKIREMYGGRYAFPPARFIGPLVILGLLIARGGIAIYTALMIALLWPVIGRREKAAVLTFAVLLCAVSVMSPGLESLTAAVDEGSATRRLAMVNESGADQRLIRSIESIEGEEFAAAKDFALGTMKSRTGRYEEARDHLLASVSRRKDFAPAYLNLGNVYFRQGDFNRALAGYQSVVAIDSTNALAWFNIGQTYIGMMLFAESSEALGRAREFGLEAYNEANPATVLVDPDIYDCGFPSRELWKLALSEGRAGHTAVLDGIFRPYLLFPLGWLWALMAAAVITGAVLAKTIPLSWKVHSCGNCGMPTCSDCSDSSAGIMLCHNCAGAIGGLSSVKVMEALLRHRRQKVKSISDRGGWLKMKVVPGSSRIVTGSPWKGMIVMSIAAAAALLMLWSGFYLGDPRDAGYGAPLVQQIIAGVVIALCWLSTVRSKKEKGQVNYRVLPADFRVEKEDKAQGRERPERPVRGEMRDELEEITIGEPARSVESPTGRRFTEQDTKAQEAFKDYLETL